MNDGIDTGYGAFNRLAVADIADHRLESGMAEHREKRSASVHETVQEADLVPFLDECQG